MLAQSTKLLVYDLFLFSVIVLLIIVDSVSSVDCPWFGVSIQAEIVSSSSIAAA